MGKNCERLWTVCGMIGVAGVAQELAIQLLWHFERRFMVGGHRFSDNAVLAVAIRNLPVRLMRSAVHWLMYLVALRLLAVDWNVLRGELKINIYYFISKCSFYIFLWFSPKIVKDWQFFKFILWFQVYISELLLTYGCFVVLILFIKFKMWSIDWKKSTTDVNLNILKSSQKRNM